MDIADSLCCTPETNTTLLTNETPIKINFKRFSGVERSPNGPLIGSEEIIPNWRVAKPQCDWAGERHADLGQHGQSYTRLVHC